MPPGLRQRKQNAGSEQQLAIDQHGVRTPHSKQPRRRAADRHDDGDLHAVIREIG